MYKELKIELESFQKERFTGHVKFGIEHGKITSLVINTRPEYEMNRLQKSFDEQLKDLCEESNENFYGTLDYNFDFGSISGFNWCINLKGEELAERLRKHQCRTVKIVTKKSDTLSQVRTS